MPELALHFAIPFALTAPVLGLRKATAVSLVSLTPDLDVLFHVHRSATHSAILLLLVSLAAVGLVSRLRPKLLGLISAGCLAVVGHPIMDLFSTYTPILYPLVTESIYLNVGLKISIGSPIWPSLEAVVNTEPTLFEEFQRFDAPLFTSEGSIVTLLLVAVPILIVWLRHARTSKRYQDV